MTAASHTVSRRGHSTPVRNLVLILGDQLDPQSAAFDAFDQCRDVLWMAENETEAAHVWCHKYRLVLFFSAMRHFRDEREAMALGLFAQLGGVHPRATTGIWPCTGMLSIGSACRMPWA